jgi:HlyD family secretion protein
MAALDHSNMASTVGSSQAVPRNTMPGAGRKPHFRGLVIRLGIPALLLASLLVAFWIVMSRGPSVRYVTQSVTRGTVVRKVSATGTVNPQLTIIVGSYVSGVIRQLFCDYNTQVKAGQICAKIDPRPYQATLGQYSAQLLRDQAVLERDQMDLNRYRKLAAQDSIARQQEEDQAKIVQQDQATVKLDEALVEGAKLNLEYTDIISPVDGTVVSRNVTQGQTVASSFQTPTLFLIATDLKKMQVDTNTSESDIGSIKKSKTATFTVDAYPGRVFTGTVTQVRQSPQTVQNVVTYDAVVTVDNGDLALMPGMTASTLMVVAERNDVVRVPNQALRYVPEGIADSTTPQAGGGTHVWVLRDGKPAAVPVELGLDDDSFTEIVTGSIAAGDQVIVAEERTSAGSHSNLPPPRL